MQTMHTSGGLQHSVDVVAPARLHMGFLDLNGGSGRRFGSLGLTLDSVATRLSMRPAMRLEVRGPGARRVQAVAERLLEVHGLGGGAQITVEEAIPEHAGLGSGTQLALAVGKGIGRLYGCDWSCAHVARVLQRGARSGIGIGAFEQGGFLVDGGHGGHTDVPPIVSRLAFPSHWRVLLVLDASQRGVHGPAERSAFQHLPVFSPALAGHVCRLVLMQVLPSLAEGDVDEFGRGITQIQQIIGDHFAPAQGGRYASRAVADVLAWLQAQGVAGVGQSSWGPTGFAVLGSEAQAHGLVQEAQARWGGGTLRFLVRKGRNRGGEVQVRERDFEAEFRPRGAGRPPAAQSADTKLSDDL
jgi:beta-ribofuranosylaminobenzene 5'-phosphate synthase